MFTLPIRNLLRESLRRIRAEIGWCAIVLALKSSHLASLKAGPDSRASGM